MGEKNIINMTQRSAVPETKGKKHSTVFYFDTFGKQRENRKRKNKHMKKPGRRRTSKGYVYTIEVLIALTIIFLAIIFVFRFTQPPLQGEIPIIKRYGFEALEYLDQQDDLRKWVNGYEEDNLESALEGILPANVKFEAEICKNTCISANVPNSVNVVTVDYYVETYQNYYLDRKVRLWLWREF